ncbi:MAG: AbrB/MazE/SpoVT family DNA-binding domain-containing protein [Candidatus Nanoarchaeia archaeon]|nr:AbrB/MazE/SpoVT family DNA-binding domain-containing protein [Candidatus Nanoarchaeia archaeon]
MKIIDIKSATITKKGQISIPKKMRENGNFKLGTKIAIIAFKDHIELRNIQSLGNKMENAIISEEILKKDWESLEEEKAWKDL